MIMVDRDVSPTDMMLQLIKRNNVGLHDLIVSSKDSYTFDVEEFKLTDTNSKVTITSSEEAPTDGSIVMYFNRIERVVVSYQSELIIGDGETFNIRTEAHSRALSELLYCHVDEVNMEVVSPSIRRGQYTPGRVDITAVEKPLTIVGVELSVPVNWDTALLYIEGPQYWVELKVDDGVNLEGTEFEMLDSVTGTWIRDGYIKANSSAKIRVFNGLDETGLGDYRFTTYSTEDTAQSLFNNVVQIISWGHDITSLSRLGGDKLISVPDYLPNQLKDLSNSFNGAGIFNGVISTWSVENIISMDSMFKDAHRFNGNISEWEVDNVISMDNMFNGVILFNQDLSDWCVTKIKSKPFDFDAYAATWTLPRPNWGTCPSRYIKITTFDAGKQTVSLLPGGGTGTYHSFDGQWYYVVRDYVDLVRVATVFKTSTVERLPVGALGGETHSISINQVVTTEVTTMNSLFKSFTSFNHDISHWDVSNVTDMSYMFQDASTFNQDISTWNINKVKTMKGMFKGASSFNTPLK